MTSAALHFAARFPHVALLALVAMLWTASGCTVAPSLSGARGGAATAPAPRPAPAPAPDSAPVVQTAPAPAAPPILPATPTTGSTVPRSDAIGLLLPLESPTYGRAAEAVRSGFMAAAERAGSGNRVRVFAHGDDGLLPALAVAERAGVALVVGPLTRDDLKTVFAMAPARPRLLALNVPDDPTRLPADAYALTLGVEGDATLLARVARADGARTVALVASDAPLQRRFATAFAAEWRRIGGAAPREFRFDANPEVLGLLRRELAARPADAMVLAVDAEYAALAKSFLPPGPVYAVSQIADGLPTTMLRDLDGVRYVEIPWLADPDAPALAQMPHANLDSAVLERLYALGLDAYALAQQLAEPVPPSRIELEGATGHLSLAPTRVFERQGRIVAIREGRLQALPMAP
jgi:outer membrane PBP1 activator LpoA protein